MSQFVNHSEPFMMTGRSQEYNGESQSKLNNLCKMQKYEVNSKDAKLSFTFDYEGGSESTSNQEFNILQQPRSGANTGNSNGTNFSAGTGNPNQLTELQKQKEALKQFILGVKPDSGTSATKKKKERELRQISHFLIDKTLGEGTFGKVKLGIHTISQEKVAIKILEKNKIQDQTDIDRIAREIKILKKIRHSRVIQLYQIIETECELYLIMEHANAGELFDYIVRNDRVDDINAAKFFHQILEGVEHLHQLGVCHRDLKPENLLLEKGKQNIKIIDFGLSNMYHTAADTLKTACGSPCYAAPEMIAGKDYKGLQVDIWSCGVILYAMLCGYLPFEDPNTDKLYKKILDCDYSIPNYVSESGRNLIQKILNTNPEERYTIQQIRNHPWFIKNFDKSKKSEPESPSLHALDIFSQKTQISDHISTNTIQQNNKNQANQEIKINPQIVQEMVEKFKIPLNPTKQGQQQDSKTNLDDPTQFDRFTVETVLKSLAHNKHNDSTTTYYLLHKKWLNEVEDKHIQSGGKSMRISSNLRSSQGTTGISSQQMQQKSKQKLIHQEATSQLITLSTYNCEQIIFKIKHQIENKNSGDKKNMKERAKNMIKIKDDRQKLIESASLVIKSPAGPALGRFNRESNQTNKSKVREIVSREHRGTKRVQVNSNNEIEIKSKQTFSLTNSNVTPNKNMASEQSSRERRAKVERNSRRIDSLTKKKEILNINPYEASKTIKTTRKTEQVESLTPIYTSKGAHKMRLTNDELKDEMNSNSQLSQSQITKMTTSRQNLSKNQAIDEAHPLKSEVSSDIIERPEGHTPMRQRPTTQGGNKNNSQNPNNINSYNSAVHSKKQSGISSQQTGPVGGYRDNSGFPNEILDQSNTPNPKIQSFKQNNSPGQRVRSTRRQAAFNPSSGDATGGPQLAMKVPVLEKTLGVASINKRYRSQQRGAKETYNFKSGITGQSKFNNYLRDRSDDKYRNSSRGVSGVSRVSKVSGTNVSYQSNLSVIRQNIHRFKHKNSPKKKEPNPNQTSINLSKNTVSSFMGLQIPRKQGHSPNAGGNISRSSKTTEQHIQKKTARISFNTKQSVKGAEANQQVKTSMKQRKDLQLNMAKVQTPLSGSKQHGKQNTTPYGKSPLKNYGNVTTRNQQINKFNTSNMMVGNSHNSAQYRQQVSKKQQNIKSLIGYGAKAQRTFMQKNSIASAKQPKSGNSTGKGAQVGGELLSMKTVNIDLDAFTGSNPMVQGGAGTGYSQTPMAGQSQPFTFNERPHTTANFNNESRQTMSMDNGKNHDEDISNGSMSDNQMDDKPPSEMPNEYSNVTQGFEALVFSTQQTGEDKTERHFGEYDLKDHKKLADKNYRRSFMNQPTNKKGNLSGTRNKDLNKHPVKSSRKVSQNNRAGQVPMSTASKGKTFGSKLSTPSQSINLNQYQTSAMNTPNADSHQYKSSFKSGSVFVGNEIVNPSHGAYMKTNKGSITEPRVSNQMQNKPTHINTYEKQVQMHKMSASYQQSQQKAKMAQTMGPGAMGSNLTANNKMKISMKGVNNFPGNTNVRASYGGNLSSRPGTSHRVMGSSNYNTVGGTKNKAAGSKATTSLGHVQGGSPCRLSSKKGKNLME